MTFLRAAERCAIALGAVEHALAKGATVIREGSAGLLGAALSRSEREALGIALYESRLGTTRTQLAAWEEAWFAEDLPVPPASILVGGAGVGRECEPLAARGYSVGAMEPGPRALDQCREAVGDRGIARVATYEQLSARVLDGSLDRALDPLVERSWDAVLLGWGSVMHVLDDAERARLIQACDRLCPKGPILATFYPSDRAKKFGRAHGTGRKVGGWVARTRGFSDLGDRESFGFACGFLRGWTREDMEATAATAGRRVLWRGDDEGSLRVTLVPIAG